MREIKFRAWDKENNIMEYNVNINQGKAVKEGKQWFNVDNTVFDSLIMQYTGLKDKNGKEIYEGDIVLYKHASYKDISRVLYYEEVGSFVMEAIKEDDNTSMARFKKGTIRGFVAGRVNGYDYVKVIGNIYENPELLEE